MPPLIVNLSTQKSGVFASADRIGNISSDILSRFVISLDYPGKKLYLKKGPGFDKPSDWNRSGFFISYEGEQPSVVWVLKDSPAGEAGVKIGDRIVEVNGKAADQWKPTDLKASLRGAAGSKMKLKLARAGVTIMVEITLRELLG